MKTPLFSIIIPAYNAQDTIVPCINSVLEQNYRNYELIVVDDGSTDSTAEIIKAMANNKINYCRKKNGGASSARNYGISKAAGEWIIFLDADDTIIKGSLKKLSDALAQNDADYIITPVESVTPKAKNTQFRKEKMSVIEKTDVVNAFIFNLPSSPLYIPRCPGGKIIKRKLIAENKLSFDERLKIFEDGVFNLWASYYADKILFFNSYIYDYNKNTPGSQSNTFYPKIADNNTIVYMSIKTLLNKMEYDSPSFPYLSLELFYNSSFASTRGNISTKQKIAKIKAFEKEYSKDFAGRIYFKNAYKTLKVVYVLCRARAYRLLLLFYKQLFKSLKQRKKI